eukprot:CAMPEP_0178383250 /NCGR_PEP_ID=MMETSP0689_2-20121128/6906_1 /TAXON_ID=160604 /ORGANISM="Amphidinium massartii, Strain CS-259" /LENGTH=1092 /DNA_ID=CAMNT_0020003467 /DNA_START=104 /DNA_END=3382 /DNA_ORIENTATION=+
MTPEKMVQAVMADLGNLAGGQRAIREDLGNLMLGQRELLKHILDIEKTAAGAVGTPGVLPSDVIGSPRSAKVNGTASPLLEATVQFARLESPVAEPQASMLSSNGDNLLPMMQRKTLSASDRHGNGGAFAAAPSTNSWSSPKSVSALTNAPSVGQAPSIRSAAGRFLPRVPEYLDGQPHVKMTAISSKSSGGTIQEQQDPMLALTSFGGANPGQAPAGLAEHWRQASDFKHSNNSAGSNGSRDGGGFQKQDSVLVTNGASNKDLGHFSPGASRELYGSEAPDGHLAKAFLPDKWPSCVALRYGFGNEANGEQEDNDHNERKLSAAISAGDANLMDLQLAAQGASGRRSPIGFIKDVFREVRFRKAMKPHSPPVIIRDITGVILLMVELIVNPFVLAWEIEVRGWLLDFAFLVAVFWTLEMLTNFMTGFSKKGEIEDRQPDAALRYLRRGFLLDVPLVTVDWFNAVMSSLGQTGNELRFVKVFRFLKVVRVARLFSLIEKIPIWRVPRLAMLAQHMIFVKLIIGTLLGNHILACGWHLLGQDTRSDTNNNWGRNTPMHSCLDPPCDLWPIGDYPRMYQYLTALHWTIAQITLGASDVTPVNSAERAYNIILLLLGLVVGSTCVSLVSAEIIKYTVTKRDQAVLLETLWRFMSQNTIHTQLRMRIMGQVNERLVERLAQLGEEDVQALNLLSVSLRQELCYATRVPHLRTHPLFAMWMSIDMDAVHALCESAVEFSFLSPQDELFLCGHEADDAYVLLRGLLTYTQVPGKALVNDAFEKECHEGTWIAEAALWSNWLHVGDCVAEASTQLLKINALALVGLLERYANTGSHIRALTLIYARNYHVRIVASMPPHAEYPNDLHVPFTDPSDLFSRHVSIGILRRAEKIGQIKLNEQQRKLIETEVNKEKCAIRTTHHGHGIERIVCVTVLRLKDDDDRVLHAIGEWHHRVNLKLDCKLPGTKRANGELPGKSLERILEDEFKPFANYLDFQGTRLDVTHKESEQYGVPTAYYRTIYEATLKQPWEELGISTARVSPVDEAATELANILSQPILMLQTKKANCLYAWLSDEEHEVLTSSECKGCALELTEHQSMTF